MKSPYWGMVWVFILAFGLVACSGDDESENSATGAPESISATGAPESILGYKMVMTVRTVEVVTYSPTVNLLGAGDTMTLQFIDENTIAGESKFNKIAHESWDYWSGGETAELNLYTSGGYVGISFEAEDENSGSFVYDGEIYRSGARTKYYGDYVLSRIDGGDGTGNGNTDDEQPDDVSGFAAELQGEWESACDEGYGDVFEFAGYELHLKTSVYDTDGCAGDPELTVRGVSGDFTIGNELTTNSGLKAYEMNITYTYVAHEDFGVEEGDQYFGIVYVENDTLYFGADNTGSGLSVSSRPTDLDFDFPYYKQ